MSAVNEGTSISPRNSTTIAEDTMDLESLNSLNASLLENTFDHDDTTLSLNDDLASVRSNSILSNGGISRRSFDTNSIFTSSFRASFDDSLPSLGLNKLSIQTVSPLGPNSIYELVADVDSRKYRTTSSSPLNPNATHHHQQQQQNRHGLNIAPPTQKDIPSIQLTKIEKIPKDELQTYLKDISKEYEKHNSGKMINSSNLQKLGNIKNPNDDMGTIPEIYFNHDFNLDDPRIFRSVTENTDLNKINHLLHDKLSNYLDVVEINLVEEISKSSGSFFDALNDLSDINEKNLKTIKSIDDLKLKLKKLKENKIDHNLKRIKLQNKRDNVSKLEQGLLQINTILKEYDLAHHLFLQSEYEDSLKKVDNIENLIKGEDDLNLNWPYKLQDLTNLKSLSTVKEKLSNLRSQAGQSISKLFISFLLTDLRSYYEEIDYPLTLKRLTENTDYKRQIDPEFKGKLKEYINVLVKSGEITTAFKTYQDHVISEMKNIVRVFLPNEKESDIPGKSNASTSTTTNQNTSGKSLSMLIKDLTPREFEDMLVKIFSTVSEGLRRLSVHQKVLLDLALNNNDLDPSSFSSIDIKDCIGKSIEIIQIRLGKIIAVRKELNSSLRIDFFLRFFYILTIFMNECENISGLNFKFLPDVLNQQIRSFNSTWHNLNLKNISYSIETEEWKPLIVSKELQRVVNNIVANEDLDFGNTWKSDLFSLGKGDDSQVKPKEEESSHKRSIVVGDKTFVANNSLLNLISITKDIFTLKSNFSQLSVVYENNLIELYKYYNGRTMQSIKKSDNTLNKEKNLSVVGESFDCITELIHFIKIDFDNTELDDQYNNLLSIIKSSKSKIDSINTIPE